MTYKFLSLTQQDSRCICLQMETQSTYSNLRLFLRDSPGLQQILNYITWDVEFDIRIGKAFAFTLKKQNSDWDLLNQECTKAHGVITFSPEGVETLLKSPLKTAEEAVDVFLKLSLAGMIKLDIKGPALALLGEASSGVFQVGYEKLHQVLKNFGLENLSRKILR